MRSFGNIISVFDHNLYVIDVNDKIVEDQMLFGTVLSRNAQIVAQSINETKFLPVNRLLSIRANGYNFDRNF